MKASRELDAEVARKVMAWTDVEFKSQTHSYEQVLQGVRPGEVASPYTGHKTTHVVPHYSRDMGAAWEAVASTIDTGNITLFKSHRGWLCILTLALDEGMTDIDGVTGFCEWVETPALAACLAALNIAKDGMAFKTKKNPDQDGLEEL